MSKTQVKVTPVVTKATKTIAVITRSQLIQKLLALKGSTMISFRAVTEPGMTKTGNPFYGKLLKDTKVNGNINVVVIEAPAESAPVAAEAAPIEKNAVAA